MTEREALKLTLAALKQIDAAMPFPVAKLAIMEAEKALAQPEYQSTADKSKLEKVPAKGTLLAQPEQQVDWEKMYRLEVKKKEALAAKYERDIKPLTRIVPMAQPEQEPVAIADGTFNHNCPIGAPLYTTPPQRTWVGLDADEVFELASGRWTLGQMAVLVEAKLKEKNT